MVIQIGIEWLYSARSPTWCLGRPTMEGKTARGASSPANPALHIPDPLSTTSAAISSSMAELLRKKKNVSLTSTSEQTPPHFELSLPINQLAAVHEISRWVEPLPYIPTEPDKRKWRCILLLPYKDMVRFWAALRLPAPWRAARAAEHIKKKEHSTLSYSAPRDHSLQFTSFAAPPIVASSY